MNFVNVFFLLNFKSLKQKIVKLLCKYDMTLSKSKVYFFYYFYKKSKKKN